MQHLGHRRIYSSCKFKINSYYNIETEIALPNLAMNVHEEENLRQMTAGLMDTMMKVNFVHHKRVLWVM